MVQQWSWFSFYYLSWNNKVSPFSSIPSCASDAFLDLKTNFKIEEYFPFPHHATLWGHTGVWSYFKCKWYIWCQNCTGIVKQRLLLFSVQLEPNPVTVHLGFSLGNPEMTGPFKLECIFIITAQLHTSLFTDYRVRRDDLHSLCGQFVSERAVLCRKNSKKSPLSGDSLIK